MEHLFLSDVHIGAFEKETDTLIKRDLIGLIEYCSEYNIRLHILGDLFDYWMEYPSWTPTLGKSILTALQAYMKKNGPVNFITGNHDNWTKGYFEKLGFQVSSEFFDITINNQRFFLHHGDGLQDTSFNLPRPFMHRILRNKMFVKLYQTLLPPTFGIKVMQHFSNYSKQRAYCDPTVLNNWAEEFLKSTEFDFAVSGHDHNPRVLHFDHGTYINLGTFFEHRTVGYYSGNDLNLVVWDSENNILYPFENRFKKAVNI